MAWHIGNSKMDVVQTDQLMREKPLESWKRNTSECPQPTRLISRGSIYHGIANYQITVDQPINFLIARKKSARLIGREGRIFLLMTLGRLFRPAKIETRISISNRFFIQQCRKKSTFVLRIEELKKKKITVIIIEKDVHKLNFFWSPNRNTFSTGNRV